MTGARKFALDLRGLSRAELEQKAAGHRKLLGEMVGTLYPQIAQRELYAIQNELRYRETGRQRPRTKTDDSTTLPNKGNPMNDQQETDYEAMTPEAEAALVPDWIVIDGDIWMDDEGKVYLQVVNDPRWGDWLDLEDSTFFQGILREFLEAIRFFAHTGRLPRRVECSS